MKRELKYYVLIVLLVAAYWAVTQFFFEPPALSTRITTTTALIAAVTFWLQLRRTENLNEANFIMNLNNQFISNKEMTSVEQKLEQFFYAANGKKAEEIEAMPLALNIEDRTHDDCQRMINYLVHMESLAAIVQRGVLHLGVIDDLFAYRFFIAVNNPVVQKYELLPYANYYQGCFKLAKMWSKEWVKSGRPLPLEEFLLCNVDAARMNQPAGMAESCHD